jgi:O-methyltransferase/methyltransferase family protein
MSEKQLSPERFIQMGMGFWAARAVISAVELGVCTELAKGPQSAEALTTSLNINARGARDFLDALVALGVIEREGNIYRNTPEADQFLDKNKPSYMGGILEMSGARLWEPWSRLSDAVRTGEPQNGAGGDPNHFDHIYTDPKMVRLFAEAMTGISTGTAKVIAAKFPWSDYKTFCDIGCAQGALPVQLALAHPHLTGIGSDLEVVRPVFDEYIARFNLQSHLRFQPCDLFKDPMPKADVYIMGHMLHGWSLAEKRTMVKRAYDALPNGGALIVFDAMIDDERRKNAFGLLMSLNMLIETPKGFDYTVGQGKQWLTEAGFRDVSATALTGPDSMVVGLK